MCVCVSQCRKMKKKYSWLYFITLFNHGSKHNGEVLPKNYKFANQLQLLIPSSRLFHPERHNRSFQLLFIAQNVLDTKVHAGIQNLEQYKWYCNSATHSQVTESNTSAYLTHEAHAPWHWLWFNRTFCNEQSDTYAHVFFTKTAFHLNVSSEHCSWNYA